MTNNVNEEFAALLTASETIGREVIRPQQNLHEQDEIPNDIWRAFNHGELSSASIPTEYGGSGLSYQNIAQIGESLMTSGGNMSVSMSWMMQQIIAKFIIETFASNSQKQRFLPLIARGEAKFAISISEPQAGANPKLLQTTAKLSDKYYIINGEKAYITNGPIADYFILLAITATEHDRKRFSAFILPNDIEGLTVTRSDAMAEMRPSCHGGLLLKNCRVENSALIPTSECAFTAISKPFRDVEDTMLMGPTVGAHSLLLAELCQSACADENFDQITQQIGTLKGLHEALRAVSVSAAAELDSKDINGNRPALLVSFRFIRQQFMLILSQLIDGSKVALSDEATRLRSELLRSEAHGSKIGTIKTKQLGTKLLTLKG